MRRNGVWKRSPLWFATLVLFSIGFSHLANAAEANLTVHCKGSAASGYVRVPKLGVPLSELSDYRGISEFDRLPRLSVVIQNLTSAPLQAQLQILADGGSRIIALAVTLKHLGDKVLILPVTKTDVWTGRLLPGEYVRSLPVSKGTRYIGLYGTEPWFGFAYRQNSPGTDQPVKILVRNFERVIGDCSFTAVPN